MNLPTPPPAGHPFFQSIENMRQVLRQGQELSGHLEQAPNWALHFERLAEIERLFRLGTAESLQQMQALNEDFLLDMNADMGMSLGEVTGRLVRTADQIAHAAEEQKFELPSEVRDDLDEILEPYHDGLRDKMLGEIPLEERQAIEAARRRLDDL